MRLCKIDLNSFKNDQNFYTFLHTLDYFEDMNTIISPKDIISSEDDNEYIVITFYRHSEKKTYPLFVFKKDAYVSIKDLGEMFLRTMRDAFVEELI